MKKLLHSVLSVMLAIAIVLGCIPAMLVTAKAEEGVYNIASDLSIDVQDGSYEYISFDYQITNDGVLFICALSPDWGKYYGYYEFNAEGKVWEDKGVYCAPLGDGYNRVILKVSEMDRTNNAANTNNRPDTIGLLYVNGSNSATGTIRNVQTSCSHIYQSVESESTTTYTCATCGNSFVETKPTQIATGLEIDVADGTYSEISFEYKVTNDGVLYICALSPDWGKYYGYYEFGANGKVWEDNGVYCESLGDGFYRVTLKTAELERTNNAYNLNNAPETIGLLFVGGSNTATGYIRNVQVMEKVEEELPQGYWVLSEDKDVDMTLSQDLYVDLNGHNLTGTINTNGFKIYGMDAATNKYTCDTMGYFSCVDAQGNAIVPENNVKTDLSGDVMRYMTIATDNGYTFHRFYVGITKQSLAPTVTGVGYKAEFYADEMVQAQVSNIGYDLWLEGGNTVSRSAAFKNTLTLRVKNYDVANYGETNLYATVWMTIGDEVITSSEYSLTLREMVEAVNDNYIAYSATQLDAVRDMVLAHEADMIGWRIERILNWTGELPELVDNDWTNLPVDSGMSNASYAVSTEKTAPGSSQSLKITTKTGDVGCIYLNTANNAVDFTNGKVTAWFYFGDQRPMAFLRGIDSNWNKGLTGIFTLEDMGNGWYYGWVAASDLGFVVDAANTNPAEMIRVAVEIPGGYTAYVDNLKWEAISVTEETEKANDLLAVSSVVAEYSTITAENSTDKVAGIHSLYSKKFTAKAGVSEKKSIRYELPQSYDLTQQALSMDVHRYGVESLVAMQLSLQDSNGNTIVDVLVDNIYWLDWNHLEIDIHKYLEDGKSLADVKYLTFTFNFDADTTIDREIYIDNVAITPYETVESSLNGTSALYIGDSISISKPFKGWAGLLEERYGVDRTNVSVGGTTFSNIGYQIKEQLKNVPEDAEFDYILLDGGCNDMYLGASSFGTVSDLPVTAAPSSFDDSTAIGGFEQLLSMLKRRFPTAKIGYIITYQRSDKWLNEFIPLAKAVCGKWGVSCLILPETEEFIQLFNSNSGAHTTDTVHSNVAGYELIMEHLPQWMESIPEPEIIEDFEPEKPIEIFEGGTFAAGEYPEFKLNHTQPVSKMSFEYKITAGDNFDVALLQDWSSYYGYFEFTTNGTTYTYDGVTTEVLSDGYVRVTVDVDKVTTIAGTPSKLITILFIRGDWGNAAGEIRNIRINGSVNADDGAGDDEGGNDEKYTEVVTPGGSFGANEGITINFEPGAYDIVTFDYKITNGGTMDICLMDTSWSKYYGYYNFGVAGATYEYDGLSYKSLGNGDIRVTLNVAQLNRTNLQNNRDNAPETVGVLFVRGDWSSAAGSIDNVRLLTKVSGGTEPDVPAEPADVSISYEFTGSEANRAGYAEGVVTLSGGNSKENYEIYWGNASGKLTDYKALATLTGANKTLAIGENVMIPAGADRLCVYVGDQLVTSYMLESKAYNAQVKTKFAVLSDVHTNYAAGETYLRTVLKKLEAEGVQYVIITGDIAESANDWGKYVSAVEDSGFTGIVMAAGGNHDLAPEARVELRKYAIYDGHAGAWVSMAEAPAYFANTYAGGLNVTAEYTDYEGNGETMYYLVAIEDNAIIFMSQDNRNCNYTNHEDNFSKAQLNFVEDALYRYSQTHNVFIAQHADVEQLVVNPGDGGSMQAYETFPNVMRFVNLLKQYPEAIWMSGHTHSPFASGVQFTDKLYVNGVITDTALARCFGCSSTASSKFTGGSEGYVCYQYENDIVYEARTFKEKDTDGNQESSFVNLTMPQYSYIIPVMIGNSHAQPILPENLIATEGVTANGTYTVKAGNQSAAWNRDAYLRFYVQTDLTNLTVGSVNVDLTAQSGSNYSIIHCIDGWKFVQVAFDSLTTKNGSVDFAVTITGNDSFQMKEMYIEPMDLSWLRGENATQGQNINLDADIPATDAVIFDYFALPGSELGIALLDDWSNYYGYFQFDANGAARSYAGITTEKLSDGYIRVTAILSEITQKVESPTKVTSLYIGGNRTTGAGMFDNVQFISGEIPEEPSDPVYRGEEIVVGQALSVMAEQAANYSQVVLDMIVPAEGGENEIGIALLDTNWNYYGYFYLEKTGLENPYAGVSAEKLSDGYWRITINIEEIDSSRTHGDVGDIERVYINNHTTGGYIDNVQFIVE